MCTGGSVDAVEGRVIVAFVSGATERWSDYVELSQRANRPVAHICEHLYRGRNRGTGAVSLGNREVP